jgi:peptidoglycan hydrolase-like protein with peptidoglycan-binding domain
LIFLLHVPTNFGETIPLMSIPRVKILFLLLILGISPLRGDEVVRAAQAKLAALGYYKSSVDGSPGSITSAAIRRFQLAENLKVTGSLNKQTLEALGIKAATTTAEYTRIGTLFEGGPLASAEAASQVEALRLTQRILADSGFYSGPPNGLPGPALSNAIKKWQEAHGLPETGKLDAHTITSLGISKP